MLAALRPLGARRSDPILNQAAKAAAQSDRLRRQLAPFAAASEKGFGSPVAYPTSTTASRSSSQASPRCSARTSHCAASRITAPGAYDTHSEQPQALADGPRRHRPEPPGLPARPRGAGPRRPRADPRLVGVRTPRGGERQRRHRPRRRRERVPDRLPRTGQMIGEFPGLKNLDEDGNLRPTSDFRGALLRARRTVARRRRRRGSSRTRARSRGRRCSHDEAARHDRARRWRSAGIPPPPGSA